MSTKSYSANSSQMMLQCYASGNIGLALAGSFRLFRKVERLETEPTFASGLKPSEFINS